MAPVPDNYTLGSSGPGAAGMLCPGPSFPSNNNICSMGDISVRYVSSTGTACRVPARVTDFWTAWSRLQEFNLDEEAVSSLHPGHPDHPDRLCFVFVDYEGALPLPPKHTV